MKPEAYLNIAVSLEKKLVASWNQKISGTIKKLNKAIEAKDESKVSLLIESIDISKALEGNRRYLKFKSNLALRFGVSRINSLESSEFVKNGSNDNKAVKDTIKQLEAVLKAQNQKIKDLVSKKALIDLAFQKRFILKKEVISTYAATKKLSNVGGNALALSTSLHTSRLAQYGFCVEAMLTGTKTYIINEILDPRTCKVCEWTNEQVYKVETLVSRLEKVIRTDDPDVLKGLAPWPKQTKEGLAQLKKMTPEQIVHSGFDAPPYHPLCRGFIDYTETQPTSVEIVTPLQGPLDIFTPEFMESIRGRTAKALRAELATSLVPEQNV